MFQVYLTLSLSYLSRFFQESCFLLTWATGLRNHNMGIRCAFCCCGVAALSPVRGEPPGMDPDVIR